MLNVLKGKFKPRKGLVPRQDDNGHESLSNKPMAIPVGFKRPETLAEQVARLVRHERLITDAGYETWEEANDFDVDDTDPMSPHEMIYDPVLERMVAPSEFERNKDHYREAYRKKYADKELPEFIEEVPKARRTLLRKPKKEEPPASSDDNQATS